MAVLGWHVRFVPTSDIPDVLPKSIGGRRLNVIRCAFRLLGLGALAPHSLATQAPVPTLIDENDPVWRRMDA